MSGGGDRPLMCDGWCKGANPVTHIGSKGYAYCAECGKDRRESGYESTRRMKAWELAELRAGRSLPSYAVQPKPVTGADTLTPYDTGEMLEPKLYVTTTSGVTSDNAAEFGKVDFDDAEGTTICTIYAHPSTIDQDTTLIQIDTLAGDRFKVMVNDGEVYNGDPEQGEHGMSCAECGTTTATTYVVTTLTPGDPSTRTEVCRDCDDAMRSKPWAICEGGLIQDSSDDVESIDLDWMENNGPHDLEEVERSWRLLNRVVRHEGRAQGWDASLHEVEEWLTSIYNENETDEDQKVWNEVGR